MQKFTVKSFNLKPPVHKFPDIESLGETELDLVKLVIKLCYFPNPETCKEINTAVFPTIRAQPKFRRFSVQKIESRKLLRDDNTSPTWALMWSHVIGRVTPPKNGWIFAHVWQASQDAEGYTAPYNLVLMPEFLGSLSDKNGPLARYFQYHAQSVYGLTPKGKNQVPKPADFENLSFRYLPKVSKPQKFLT